jgi:O-antigen biosynthesis protein
VGGNWTPQYREWLGSNDVNVVELDENKGFTGNVNAGIDAIGDDDVVLCNDDVVMLQPDWVKLLQSHTDTKAKRKNLGAVGAVSNYVKKHQLYQMPETRKKWIECDDLSFFFCFIPRSAIEKVGKLDEAFGIGLFDDDDWCRRAREQSLRLVLDRRIFLWHWGNMSLNNVVNYREQMMKNKKIFEEKHLALATG